MKVCWISIIGRPNVGKSTLLNKIINYNLSIVSNKPQTTRDNLLGIYNDNEYQLIFTDTPGIHKPQSILGDKLNKKAFDALDESDLILFLQPINEEILDGDLFILNKIKKIENKIAIITKIDLIKNNEQINNKIAKLKEFNFKEILLASNNNDNLINNIINQIKKFAYEDKMYYDEDFITDKSELFLSKEIIRLSTIEYLKQELPHSIAIEINTYKVDDKNNKREIHATIYCAKESQKRIIIGKQGQIIKKIGMKSRKKIAEQFLTKVNLFLNVKVDKNWINDKNQLKKYGY